MLDELATKTAAALGYEQEPAITQAKYAGKSLNQVLGQVPLIDLLPYQSFDTNHELYYNQTNTGFVLEISPLMGSSEEMIKTLNGILSEVLPDGAISQWLIWASPKIAPGIEHWSAHRSRRGGWYAKMAQERQQHLLKGAFTSLVTASPYYRLRNFRCFVSVNMETADTSIEVLGETREKLISSFSAMRANTHPLGPNELLTLLYAMVNPSVTPFIEQKKWESSRSLSAQCVSPETKLTITEDGLYLGDDYVVTTYSAQELPDKWIQQQNLDLLGSEDNEHRQPVGEFFISAVVQALDKESVKNRALIKGSRAKQLAESKLAKLMPRAKKIHQDWQYVNERIDVGDRLVQLYYQIVCYSHQEDIKRAESAIKEVYNTKGWRVKKDKYLCLQSWLSILPLRVDKALFNDLKMFYRVRTIMSFNAANLLPLQGEWKGGNAPGLLLFGRRGQICWFDPFANMEGNYNVAVAGKSRSGKSVLMQDLAAGIVGSGGRVFIFDIGRSFEKSCKYLGGQFIEFHPDVPICINPFSAIDKFDEALELLLPMFSQMASSKRDLDDLEESYLQQALRATWDSYGQNSDATKVAAWLNEHPDSRAKDLGAMLYPYTTQGRYGRYLNGRCSLDFTNPYIVLELEELKVKKDLQSVVLMIMMYHVTECMYRGDRKQKIMCIIDEAWDLMANKTGGQFIEVGYRRAAKYSGAFVSGTQMLDDYNKTASSRAARANADTLLILAQDAAVIDSAADNKLIDNTPHFKMTLKSVKTIDNQYAEVCIKTPSGYGVNRLLLDPFSRTLYSSKGVVVAAVNDLIAKGCSVEEAVCQVSEQIKRGEL